MVFGGTPECSNCKSNESQIWQRGASDEVLCITCFKNINGKPESDTSDGTDGKNSIDIKKDPDECDPAVKSHREDEENDERDREVRVNLDKKECKRKNRKGRPGMRSNVPKGKSRRYIFKKNVSVLFVLS